MNKDDLRLETTLVLPSGRYNSRAEKTFPLPPVRPASYMATLTLPLSQRARE